MSWIIDEAQILLADAGYSVMLLDSMSTLAFEDDEVIGFIVQYEDGNELIANFIGDQTDVLKSFSPALRSAGEKAWNVYFVGLTESDVSSDVAFEIDQLEFDLTFTRKLARSSIKTISDVKVALAPLLPIESQPHLAAEDLEGRLRSRIVHELGEDVASAFMGSADESTVARTLLEAIQ